MSTPGLTGSTSTGSASRTPVFRRTFSPTALNTTSNSNVFQAKAKPRSAPGLLRLRLHGRHKPGKHVRKDEELEVIRNADRRGRNNLVAVGVEDVVRNAEVWRLHQESSILSPYIEARTQFIGHAAAKKNSDVRIPFRVEVGRSRSFQGRKITAPRPPFHKRFHLLKVQFT